MAYPLPEFRLTTKSNELFLFVFIAWYTKTANHCVQFNLYVQWQRKNEGCITGCTQIRNNGPKMNSILYWFNFASGLSSTMAGNFPCSSSNSNCNIEILRRREKKMIAPRLTHWVDNGLLLTRTNFQCMNSFA